MQEAIELYTENGITLYDVGGVVYTTTASIAEKFGKRKGDVDEKLKKFPDFEELVVNGKIRNHEISVSTSIKPIKTTHIDRDVMTLLIMGFTGDKAYEWKKQYIEAFNLMELRLSTPQLSIKQEKINILKNIISQNANIINQNADIIDQNEKVVKLLIDIEEVPQLVEEDKQVLIEYHNEKDLKIVTDVVRSSYTKQTTSEYYNLKVSSIKSLQSILDDPAVGIVIFNYYNPSTSIIHLEANEYKALKIPTPKWLKELGDYGKYSCKIKFRTTQKKGFLDKLIEG
jgi:phage regulator Rha-like protein